ncbi:hypothetical protein AUJ65_02610 [Candidatus Micrarchaeota archaeon CG1_02_51_15]|nr:MAG: hypothetical protein AUJ65_02610 [Candidatus Micrarchaeota archaeon CG1_02_51_15]
MYQELRAALKTLEEGRAVARGLPEPEKAFLRTAWVEWLRKKTLPKNSGEKILNAVRYCQTHGFNASQDGRRALKVASLAHNPLFDVQKKIFERIAERTGAAFIYPAMGFDVHFLPANANFLEITPDELPKDIAKQRPRNLLYLRRKAEDLTAADAEETRKSLGGKGTVLVLKGIQSVLGNKELCTLFERTKPTHVLAMETPARQYCAGSAYLPAITPELERLLENKGFRESTGKYFTANEQRLLERIHETAASHFAFDDGHFPGIRTKVYEKHPNPTTRKNLIKAHNA